MSSRGEAGTRVRTGMVLVAAVVVATLGLVLLATGLQAFDNASDARQRADTLDRTRAATVTRTHAADRDADAPIGRTEKIAASVSDILDAGDSVIEKSAATSAVLQRAVQLANNGNVEAARALYTGDAATSVRGLNDELAKARAALATARQAVAELTAPAP